MTTLLAPDPLSILADPTASLSKIMAALATFEEAGPFTGHASIGLSSNATIDLLGVFLRKHAALNGVRLTVHQGNFDDPIGDIERFRQGGVGHLVLLPFFDMLLPAFEAQLGHLSEEAVAAKEAEVSARYRLVFEQAREFRTVFVGDFHRLSLSAEPAATDAVDASIGRLNRALRETAESFPNIRILDLDATVAAIGRAAAFDGRFYLRNKAPYATGFLNELARRITVTSRGFSSYFYKALVLDCDNTLWGGTIGEDLLAGIRLGPHDYPGNVFWQVQNELAALERRGVLLCLCSKNNAADVDDVVARHPDMVLRDHHLVVKKVNWADKVSNLREIATELNIGLDSLVFLDDSPFECDAVRTQLPMVRTVQVPAALSEYPRVIQDIKELFLAGGIAGESRSKTEQYRQRAAAEDLKSRFSSNDDYLASLNLRIELSRDVADSVPRLSELTLKSNQFNLTTRRYSENDMRGVLDCANAAVYSLVVSDKFGNAGLTGVAILRWTADTAEVEAFLLSCRVIGRGIEFAIWPAILRDAAARGCTRIAATYSPSAKNAQVAAFWDRLGLSSTTTDDGIRHYSAPIDGFTCPPTPWIEIIRC
ncbi:MAG TPA: HAD-IIIC family phosphatase [Stellaceae bacterium]|nr:HAD-IIIC family phosphatase [Stellaceae bacterium]